MFQLSHIASNIHKCNRPISSSIVAVVTDVTRPLYRQKQGNYIVMLKLVDQTLNDHKLFGVMSKDCSVYLISKNKKDIDFVTTIGEIVLLDKFTFSLWNGIKLETKYLHITEGIYSVTIDPVTDQLLINSKLTLNPQLLDISPRLVQRVKQLMEWRSTVLPTIYEPKLGVSILNSHCVMIEPFNIILAFEGKMQAYHSNLTDEIDYMLVLKDTNGNTFFVRHNSDNFEPGDLLLIRGIQSIDKCLQLLLTQTGNVLRFAYKMDTSLMNYMAIHRDNQKLMIDKNQNDFTLINCDATDLSYITQLIQLQDKYNHSSKKQDIEIRDAYFIKAIAINFQGHLSLYHREFQIMLDDEFYNALSEEEKKQYKEFNRIGYVYEGVLGLIDRSNESKGLPFYAHLFTSDSVGNFLTPEQFQRAEKSIGTNTQQKARAELLQAINTKLTKITSLSNFSRPVSLALEPIKSEKLLFRISNTKIL